MQFGAVRKVAESDGIGEYDAVDLTMTRREFKAFSYVVQSLVVMQPPKPDGNTSLRDFDRDDLVESLATANCGRFRTVITVTESHLNFLSSTLDNYIVNGAIHSLVLGVDPTEIPGIAQTAASMARQINANNIQPQ